MEQNRESSEIHSHTHCQLIFNKEVKNRQWQKNNLFNKWCWENGISTCKRLKLDAYLTPYTKKSTQNRLKCKPKTVNLLKEKLGEKFHDFGLGKDVTPRAQATEINK